MEGLSSTLGIGDKRDPDITLDMLDYKFIDGCNDIKVSGFSLNSIFCFLTKALFSYQIKDQTDYLLLHDVKDFSYAFHLALYWVYKERRIFIS